MKIVTTLDNNNLIVLDSARVTDNSNIFSYLGQLKASFPKDYFTLSDANKIMDIFSSLDKQFPKEVLNDDKVVVTTPDIVPAKGQEQELAEKIGKLVEEYTSNFGKAVYELVSIDKLSATAEYYPIPDETTFTYKDKNFVFTGNSIDKLIGLVATSTNPTIVMDYIIDEISDPKSTVKYEIPLKLKYNA